MTPKQSAATAGRISPAQARIITGENPQAAMTTKKPFTAKTTVPSRQISASKISRQAGKAGEIQTSKPVRSSGGVGGTTAKKSGVPGMLSGIKNIQKALSGISGIERGPSSGAFSALGFQPSSFGGDGPFGFAGFNVGEGSWGGGFGSISDFGVGDTALLGAMKEGGFVRKKT
jgi:hypothetical protein